MQQTVELPEQVRSIVAGVLGLDEDEIADNASQDTLAEWSSLKHMLLMVALEEHFSTELTMDEMLAMHSLPEIVNVIRGRGLAQV